VPDEFFEPHACVALVDAFVIATYEGDWRDNVPHGEGTATFTNGAVYVGGFERGRVHGRGELTCVSAPGSAHSRAQGPVTLSVVGSWRGARLNDTHAVWKKDSALGGAVEVYAGPFRDGLRHGDGAVVSLADGSHYEGPYRSGLRNGIGECRYANKEFYSGKFVGDKRNGKGQLLRCNGDVHVGLWKDDVLEGPGIIRRGVGSEEVHGLWKRGVMVQS
jgi:hypothetical protein